MARPAPTAAAVRTLGRRSCHTMLSRSGLSVGSPMPRWCKIEPHTSAGVMFAGPKVTAKTTEATTAAASTTVQRAPRAVLNVFALLAKVEGFQLRGKVGGGIHRAHSSLTRCERHDEIAVILHGVELRGGGVTFEHADLLLY